jgi:hypothetical protein
MPATAGRAVAAQGASFSFTANKGGGSFSGGVTKVSVDTPQAEITDVTGLYDTTMSMVKVPTGATTGGLITVEFIVLNSGSMNIDTLIGKTGTLAFNASGYILSKNVIVESASSGASVGDVFRGTMKFVPTDWYGN